MSEYCNEYSSTKSLVFIKVLTIHNSMKISIVG